MQFYVHSSLLYLDGQTETWSDSNFETIAEALLNYYAVKAIVFD